MGTWRTCLLQDSASFLAKYGRCKGIEIKVLQFHKSFSQSQVLTLLCEEILRRCWTGLLIQLVLGVCWFFAKLSVLLTQFQVLRATAEVTKLPFANAMLSSPRIC